jgi:hypothetical protein
MTKITLTAVVAAAVLTGSPAFAGDHACCAKGAHSDKVACANFTTLHLNADQTKKLESWQSECMKAGCTKESRAKFLSNAKGILSAEQYAKLKEQCGKSAKKSEA